VLLAPCALVMLRAMFLFMPSDMCAWLLHAGLVQVSALFANPWLEHIECHELLAGLAGVLVELQQHEGASASSSSSSSDGSSTHFSRQLQQLFLTWRTEEMRRWA